MPWLRCQLDNIFSCYHSVTVAERTTRSDVSLRVSVVFAQVCCPYRARDIALRNSRCVTHRENLLSLYLAPGSVETRRKMCGERN